MNPVRVDEREDQKKEVIWTENEKLGSRSLTSGTTTLRKSYLESRKNHTPSRS